MASNPSAPSSPWTEHTNAEGRTYWYHTVEKRSVWEKPSELKTPFEKVLETTPWKEYVTNGRKYYVNSNTKESSWTLPEEVKQLMAKVEAEQPTSASASPAVSTQAPSPARQRTESPALAGPPQAASQSPGPGGAPSTGPASQPYGSPAPNLIGHGQGTSPQPQTGTPGPPPSLGPSPGTSANATPLPPRGGPGAGPPAPGFVSGPSLPSRPMGEPPLGPKVDLHFRDHAEAERAFMDLLRRTGVDATWTWEQTMREVITDPLYKALKTLAERKTAYQKYVEELKRREQEEREARAARLKPVFREMFSGDERMRPYTSFRTAQKFFGERPEWKQVPDEAERRQLFEEVMSDFREKEAVAQRETRHRNMDMLMSLLKSLELDARVRWRDAQAAVIESADFQNDAQLQQLEGLDMLIVFEEYAKSVEKEFYDQRQKQKKERERKARKAREQFIALLDELKASGALHARSKWKTLFPSFASDERYLNLLGQPGSDALEIFFFAVDELDKVLDAKMDKVEDVLKAKGKTVEENTEAAEFESWLQGEESVADATDEDRKLIFEDLHSRAAERARAERRRQERVLRHQAEDLRYALKKMEPPLDLDASFEEVRPRIAELDEFKVMGDENEEARKGAWTKFVRRQKEKLEMAERERERSRDRSSRRARDDSRERERDRHRDRDRDRHHRERSRDRRERGRETERDRASERSSRSPGGKGRTEDGTDGQVGSRKRARYELDDDAAPKRAKADSDVEEGQL